MPVGEALTLASIAMSAGKAALPALAAAAAAPIKRKINAGKTQKLLQAAYADAARAFLQPFEERLLTPLDLASLEEMVKDERWAGTMGKLIRPDRGQIDSSACRAVFEDYRPAGVEASFFDEAWQRLIDEFKDFVANSDSKPVQTLCRLYAEETAAGQRAESLKQGKRGLEQGDEANKTNNKLLAAVERGADSIERAAKSLERSERGQKKDRAEPEDNPQRAKRKRKRTKKGKPLGGGRQREAERSSTLAAIEAARGSAQKDVLALLDDAVWKSLVGQRRGWSGKTRAFVAHAICSEESLQEVATVLNDAHELACETDGGAAVAGKLEGIAARVAPTIFWARMGIGTAQGRVALREEIPHLFDSLVELLLAGFEQKPYSFTIPAEETFNPPGRNKLPLPAEIGCASGAEAFDQFIEHLASEHLKIDPAAWEDFRSSEADRVDYLNLELEQAAKGLKGRRRYLVATLEERLGSAELFELIEERLEPIHVVYKMGKTSPMENAAFLPLRYLLVRANKRKDAS